MFLQLLCADDELKNDCGKMDQLRDQLCQCKKLLKKQYSDSLIRIVSSPNSFTVNTLSHSITGFWKMYQCFILFWVWLRISSFFYHSKNNPRSIFKEIPIDVNNKHYFTKLQKCTISSCAFLISMTSIDKLVYYLF